MIKRIKQLENKYNIIGDEPFYGDSFIRKYYCKPTEDLYTFLNKYTNNLYVDTGWEMLDLITLEIEKDLSLVVATWEDDEDDYPIEINEAITIKVENHIDFYDSLLSIIICEE